jgi:hypothetical protein
MSPSKTEISELTRALRTSAKHIGIACFCLYALACHAQTPVLNNVVSPSPNASALAEYVQTSTNLYTGVPSITVPVHTITSKKLSWPIVLSYPAAGTKVNEVGGPPYLFY